ncbi:zinc finger protein 121-like [Sitophilus oryzae]|uniref:Zinc finger protein 121-like n=1 Tax=Sitophilus oryzae TaxID=7048 RepID=A0A6J2XXE8_SITOR|nr:zinc finger protein 121-like [Sitophilus oryzae]XP_030755751.1 zinc finger protein 121-like [Sitophilus oryzae]XP_030755752.1 zinc finger protein 121-like [Sitophilus oryzae]
MSDIVAGIEHLSGAEAKKSLVFKCSECDYTASRKFRIEQHQIVHIPLDKRPRYYCNHCPSKFISEYSFYKHVKSKHNSSETRVEKPVFQCCRCSYKTHRRYLLEHHKKFHLPEERTWFQCKHCGARYTTMSGLHNHFQIKHSSETLTGFDCKEDITIEEKINIAEINESLEENSSELWTGLDSKEQITIEEEEKTNIDEIRESVEYNHSSELWTGLDCKKEITIEKEEKPNIDEITEPVEDNSR